MTSVVLRSWWRRSAAALGLLAIVAGLAGGVVTGLLVGATRTRSAYDRFVAASHTPDLYVDSPDGNVGDAAAIRRVPGVAGVGMIKAGGIGVEGSDLYLAIGMSLDEGYARDVNTARIVAGRAARSDADDEVVLSEPLAAALRKSVGDELRLNSFTPKQVGAMKQGDDPGAPAGPTATVTVVGIQRTPFNVVTDKLLSDQIIFPAGFAHRYGDRIGAWTHMIYVDVEGASPTRVADQIHALPGFEDRLVQTDLSAAVSPIQPTLDFVAVGLMVLAGVVGFTGLAAVVLVVLRVLNNLSDEAALLGALGATRGVRRRALALVAVPSALASLLVALAAATATSVFVPFGIAERADPNAGLRFAGATVVLGATVTALVVLLLALACAQRAVTRTTHRPRTGRLGAWVRRGGSPATVVGIAFAFDRGSGRRAAGGPVAVAGLAIAGAALVATFVFVASTTYLLDEPRAYGWTWDVQVTGKDGITDRVAKEPGVAAASEVRVTQGVRINGIMATVRGLRVISGDPPLRIVQGHAPNAPDEVVLGKRAMSLAGVNLGDRLVIGEGDRRHTFHVVGSAVFAGVEDVPTAGIGVAIPLDQLVKLEPNSDDGFTTGLITLKPGVDRDAFVERITRRGGAASRSDGAEIEVVVPSPGADIERLADADSLPWALVVFLATVGVLSLASAAVSIVRRRRRDLGVLRVMGFTRANARATFVVQALALTVSGLVIGVPAGLILGRFVWRWFATNLGVAQDVITPWPLVVAFAVASLAVFTLGSLLPARAAARIRPSDALRTE